MRVACGRGWGWSAHPVAADHPAPARQALLEEIEQHGEKVEECQELAKQYINAIKVRLPGFLRPSRRPGMSRESRWVLRGHPEPGPRW